MAISFFKRQRESLATTTYSVCLWCDGSREGTDYNLEAAVFILGENKKLLSENHFVFYNNLESPSGSCKNIDSFYSGEETATDNEIVKINLSKIETNAKEICIVVFVEFNDKENHTFEQLKSAYVSFVNDNTNEVIATCDLTEDFSNETAVEFGRLYERNGSWKFEASGIGYKEDLAYFVNKHYSGQVIK